MGPQFLEEGERLIARPYGRMEAADGSEFGAAVEQRVKPKTKSVTIDLEELDFVSLGGVRAILRLARSLKGAQKSLDFVHGGEAVRETFKQAGFDELFAFTPPFHSHRGIRT
jgi:anti-anti-sigma factor